MAFRKQEVCHGQAGLMVLERLTELEHVAVARMDTEQWLVQKANVLHKLDRLVQWLKSDLQNGHKRAAFRKQHVCYGQADTMVLERLTELSMLQSLEWTQESGLYRKQTVNITGQADTIMAQDRLTKVEHAAVARMDTREWLVQKAKV